MSRTRAREPRNGSQFVKPDQLVAASAVRIASGLAIALGILLLGGWAYDLNPGTGGNPPPLAAILLIATGLGLAVSLLRTRWSSYAAPLLAALVFAVSASASLLPERAGYGLNMPHAAAVLFMLVSAALLLSRAKVRSTQAGYVAAATVALLLVTSVLVGFLFGIRALHETGLNGPVSLPLTLGQGAAVAGVLCLRLDLGWMRLLSGPGAAARELRSLAIGVIALLLAFAAVLQIGLQRALYGPELGTALAVLGSIVVVFVALLMTAARLRRIDDERRATLAAQRRVESELGLALAAAKMIGFQCDLRTRTVRRFSSTGGQPFTQERDSYENHLRAVHPDDRGRVESYLAQRFDARHTDYQLQYRLLRPDSSVAWVLDKGQIRYDEREQPIEITGVAIDVTQTVQTREALRESEARFHRLAESMPQIVYISGPDGVPEYVNSRWREYTGQDSAKKEDYERLIPAEDIERLSQAWSEAARSGAQLSVEFRLRGVDGTYRWFLTRAVPVRDANGTILRWCGTSTDIDAQKRAHEELRLVTDHADILLAHCDADERYVFVNNAYTDRFQCAPEDVVGKPLSEVLGATVYAQLEPYVKRALAGEHVAFDVEIPYEQIGTHFMHCRYVPDIDGASGCVRGFVATIADVSERRQLEEQLRERDRRKDEFLALLAHELRNPLAPIRYAVGLLKPDVPKEIATAARDVIERQVAHMARLVEDLLDVSRVTRGSLELRLERLDLRAVVTAAVDSVRPLFEAVNHTLTVSLPPEPAPIMGDLARLMQVVGNLLNNAGKYTNPGGCIEVEVERDGAEFVVRVRDTGIGIAPEFLPRLFELFAQGDRTHTRASGGLGVGLSLAKRLVEMHRGSIHAHSDGIGRGSVISVRFLSAAEEGVEEPNAIAENVLPIFQRRHQLLIVDDNLDAANGLAILAQLSGYVTHIANDGLAAIEMAEIVRPEAIIMDLGMPKMTGFEAARWVRQQPWGRDTVLIAVTGWGQDEDRRKSREAGFDVHLTKPVDSTELLNHLQQQQEQRAKGTG